MVWLCSERCQRLPHSSQHNDTRQRFGRCSPAKTRSQLAHLSRVTCLAFACLRCATEPLFQSLTMDVSATERIGAVSNKTAQARNLTKGPKVRAILLTIAVMLSPLLARDGSLSPTRPRERRKGRCHFLLFNQHFDIPKHQNFDLCLFLRHADTT